MLSGSCQKEIFMSTSPNNFVSGLQIPKLIAGECSAPKCYVRRFRLLITCSLFWRYSSWRLDPKQKCLNMDPWCSWLDTCHRPPPGWIASQQTQVCISEQIELLCPFLFVTKIRTLLPRTKTESGCWLSVFLPAQGAGYQYPVANYKHSSKKLLRTNKLLSYWTTASHFQDQRFFVVSANQSSV